MLRVFIVRAFANTRRTPKRKPPPEQHLITSLTHFQIVQKLQDNVKNNKGLYFICFLCKFVRGEGVVRVVGGVVISLRCTTSNGESSYYTFDIANPYIFFHCSFDGVPDIL
jgi:hypothetical protein